MICSYWEIEKQTVFNSLKNQEKVILIGDGRCDSPGHSTKYGTYINMDANSGKVVDLEFVAVSEVKNSNSMEKEGFVRIINTLLNEGLQTHMISTDRHPQIRQLMRADPSFNSIIHTFDPWHIIKELNKMLNAISKQKVCGIISKCNYLLEDTLVICFIFLYESLNLFS